MRGPQHDQAHHVQRDLLSLSRRVADARVLPHVLQEVVRLEVYGDDRAGDAAADVEPAPAVHRCLARASGQGNRDAPHFRRAKRELVRSFAARLEAVALRGGVRPLARAIPEERTAADGRRAAAGGPGVGPASRLMGLAGPRRSGMASPTGMLAAADGTAWFVAQSGRWRLCHERREAPRLKAPTEIPAPGYAQVAGERGGVTSLCRPKHARCHRGGHIREPLLVEAIVTPFPGRQRSG